MEQQGAALQSLTASVNNVLNVMAPPYNALSDSNTANYSVIQQAIWDAENATPPTFPSNQLGRTVYLPSSPDGKCYAISQPLRIASGPIEIKGDLGSCVTKKFYGPTIIQVPWGVDNMATGPALVGTGTSFVSASSEPVLDLAHFLNTSHLNLATEFVNGFDIEFWDKPTSVGGALLESSPSNPGSGDGMYRFFLDGSNKLNATINTIGGLVTLSACSTAQTLGTAYDAAVDWDKTTYRLFQNGVLCSSVASANPPALGPFEAMLIPDLGHWDYWMAGGTSHNPFQGYLDDIRFERASLHTTAYSPLTTRFVADNNTTLLLDPSVTSPDASFLAHTYDGLDPVYLPVLLGTTSSVITAHIHDLEPCSPFGDAGDGYIAQWGVNSEVDHVSCSNAAFAGLDFYNNDYGVREHDNISLGGMLGILHGVAWNGSIAHDDRMDSNKIACEETVGDGGGGFHDSGQNCINRGNLLYCKMYMGIGFASEVDGDGCDQEAGDSSFLASILINNSIAIQFNAPDLSGVSGHPFIEVDGGSQGPTIINGQFQQGTGATEIIHFGSAPSSPALIVNPVTMPTGVPLSNEGGNPNILQLGNGQRSVVQSLELQQVPKFDSGLAHLTVNPIADPAAATISVGGATGSAAYGPYFVVCRDANGGVTLPSPSSNTIANGPTTLSSGNYINITWSAVTGCTTWDVLKGNTGTALAQGVTGTSYRDIGGSTAAYTAPIRNTTGDVSGLAQISTGTTFSKLPAMVVNGARIYCSDCDPPANPPVACTHSGAKTGAFADGVNNTWLCAP